MPRPNPRMLRRLTYASTLEYKCKTSVIEFTCNLCGQPSRVARDRLDRESPTCTACGSNVRTRSLIRALSLEIFGANLALPDFPRLKSIRGLGIGDSPKYAGRLTEIFDYRNTFYARQPRLDITAPPDGELGAYDFIISSEVFEHVLAPVEKAFKAAFRLLKPHGVLLLTVPYSLAAGTTEHFGKLYQFGLAQVGDRVLLVNRTAEGKIEVHDDLVFHFGSSGPVLEMREFSESALRSGFIAAGFGEVRIYSENDEAFGIVNAESWSLPIAARRGSFVFTRDSAGDVLEQWATLRKRSRELAGSFWVRLAGKLGLVDLAPLMDRDRWRQ
jgi:SAM-dependent methyltransferase